MPRDRTTDRRFTLADLMVLVAATGAGLTMFRPYLASLVGPGFQNVSHPLRTIETTYGSWSFVAAWWMVALLILQYRRPHPSRGRLARRPGHVACCVGAVALGVGILDELTRLAFANPTGVPFSYYQLWITVSRRVGLAVAGAWLLLALSGRWRADCGWIDRLGRFLGCCWIGWFLLWLLPHPIRAKIPPFWDGVLL
jgi:hypothetical protein